MIRSNHRLQRASGVSALLQGVGRVGAAASLLLCFAAPLRAQEEPSGPPGPAGSGGPQRAPRTETPLGWVGFAFGPDPADPSVARVLNVVPGSPAARAGLRRGEAILTLDGRPLEGPAALQRALDAARPGQRLVLDVLAGERRRKLRIAVEARDVRRLCARALATGAEFLAQRQGPEGGWRRKGLREPFDVPLSALCLRALAGLPQALRARRADRLAEGLRFLLRFQGADGAILGHPHRQSFRTYASALTLQCLCRLGGEDFASARTRLIEFLRRAQIDEEEGIYHHDAARYGGWNLFDTSTPATLYADVSNTSYALEGLADAGLDPRGPTAEKARLFLRRAQNLPRPGTHLPPQLLDGGFVGNARTSKAGRRLDPKSGEVVFRPYGSTTADGLRSLLRAGVAKNDPRAEAAARWLGTYFNTRKNPNFPRDERQLPEDSRGVDRGIYYYYLASLCDALALYGEPTLTGRDGRSIPWAERVALRLVGLQQEDGAWRGDGSVINEDDPNLATAFALLALARCQPFLEK